MFANTLVVGGSEERLQQILRRGLKFRAGLRLFLSVGDIVLHGADGGLHRLFQRSVSLGFEVAPDREGRENLLIQSGKNTIEMNLQRVGLIAFQRGHIGTEGERSNHIQRITPQVVADFNRSAASAHSAPCSLEALGRRHNGGKYPLQMSRIEGLDHQRPLPAPFISFGGEHPPRIPTPRISGVPPASG